MTRRNELDLDAVIQEQAAEPWSLSFRGHRFTMPGTMAAEALVVYGRWINAQRDAEATEDQEEANYIRLQGYQALDRLTALLFSSDEDYATFTALRPTEAQRQALVLAAIRRWGGAAEPGESQDSQPSSAGSGRPVSPTSLASTG